MENISSNANHLLRFWQNEGTVRYQNIALIVLLTIMAAYTFLLEGKDVGSDMEEESDMVSED